MIPVFQDMSVANDGHGNCFNACIASLLERPLREVAPIHPRRPVQLPDGTVQLEENEKWHEQWDAWLIEQGYKVMYHPASDPPKGFSIASGYSDRTFPEGHRLAGKRISHAVVAFDGVPVHDPYPLRGTFGDVVNYKTLERIGSVERAA